METQSAFRILVSQLCSPLQFAHAMLVSWNRKPVVPPQLEDITWEDTQ